MIDTQQYINLNIRGEISIHVHRHMMGFYNLVENRIPKKFSVCICILGNLGWKISSEAY